MPGKRHNVQPNSNGGWDVRRSGSKRASGHFDTKKEAVARAREISNNEGTELVVRNLDGTISERDSHGNDPRSSRG